MKTEKKYYDLIIIGAGPAGTPVAIEYAMLNKNKKILIVDKRGKLGGACLFNGCIPSKILKISGEHLNKLNKLEKFGIKIKDNHPRLVWEDIVKKKNYILSKRSSAAEDKMAKLKNVTLKKGTVSFLDENTVIVTSDNNQKNIKFNKAVIATGAKPFIPPFKGNGVGKVLTNEEFFDRMVFPEDITIIGDGPIGIELSQMLSQLGTKINLIGNTNSILPMIDQKFANIILENLKKNKNIKLFLNANVVEINYNNNIFEIIYKQNNLKKRFRSSNVLVATGRRANIKGLGLENAKIKSDSKGIVVNKYSQTTNKNIYAAGDVTASGPKFAHTASYEAHIISQNLFFAKNKIKTNFDKNSWVLFSDPNIVTAGVSEEEAKRKNIDIITDFYDYSIDAKAQIEDENFGYLKFIVDKKTLQIIGISIITENANVLAGEAAIIITQKLTLKDLVNTIQAHPTLSESFTFLAKKMMSNIILKRMENPLFKIIFTIKKYL